MGAFACKKGGEGEATAKGITVSAEMQDFLGGLKGKSSDVQASLAKHGIADLATADMDMYDLSEAKVTTSTGACYTIDAKAGMTVRTYDVCWEGGKINKVVDKGMR
mgnify:CR=1 FL=1